jgi:hypothetical protein
LVAGRDELPAYARAGELLEAETVPPKLEAETVAESD